MNTRQLFLQHLAQTSPEPLSLEIVKAKDCKLYDATGKAYIDLIGGISVCNTGHSNPKIINAVKEQAERYMHIMVYGELIQSPQVQYATLLTQNLPPHLNAVYFTNSGAEAVEGAMKLAKRHTKRSKIIAFKNSYHGSTQGALSLLGDEYWRNAYRPLLPNIFHFDYNDDSVLEQIDEDTAAVIMEPVQAEAGVIIPNLQWIKNLQEKCKDKGSLLILDEIQTGFGRTGSLFAFEQLSIEPDILLLGKALGGGMPLGAFIADKKIMDDFIANPVLGHITTFGGHPVCCAAGLASLEFLLAENLIENVNAKAQLFLEKLIHPRIQKITHSGLMMAVHLDTFEMVINTIQNCLKNDDAVFTDWFLFANNCIRIVPPLIITEEEIEKACETILKALDEL